MIAGQPVVVPIDDASQIGEARRAAVALAQGQGFDETGRGQVAIVVTEFATNLFKHAQDGELVLQALECGDCHGLEILSLDRGPGIVDVDRCLTDGYSTAGSSGHGLGAIVRLSSLFDIDSSLGSGTICSARLWAGPVPQIGVEGRLEWGVVSLAMPGEEVCGDSWGVSEAGGQSLILVVDGLGHGPQAAEAARAAVDVFHAGFEHGPAAILRLAHEALRSTRGAAMAVAQLDAERREIRFCGIGNIAGAIVQPGLGRTQSMVSHNGIVGHTIRKVQEFVYPWEVGASVVLNSDGLTSHWHLDRYRAILARHPSLLAGALYRDFKRGRDDVTVLVARETYEAP